MQDQYQSHCRDYLGKAVNFQIHNLRKQQQQQNQAIQSTQLNVGNDDQSAQQLQMLLQQQQQVAAQKQQPQMQATVQNQNQMQMPNQNQSGLNPMMANMIHRNFTQDTSGTLAMNMQSYIQSQQQVSQQRAQQQQQQQTPQQAQAQPQQLQQQAQQMRQQFGLSNPSVNQSNLNALNSSNLYAQQQQYAANLAAAANQQRANGLSTLNQPINPAVQAQAQAQQRQQTAQVQPTQFPQVPDANTTYNQQLRNPLQTAHQFQQSLPQAEIDQIALDLARFKVYTWISKPKNIQDIPPHIRDSNDKAQQKIKGLQNMGLTGILEQIKKAINIIQPRLEAEAGIRVRQNAPAVATDESEATGLNTLQQPMNTVVQQLPQAQAAAAKQQAMNRSVNQSTLPEQSPQAQQMQNLRTQPQALPRPGAGLATLQNVQAPVQGQNPMQTPSMNPQNLNMLQQFQLTRELANNQQLFANLNQQQTNAGPNAQQLALMAQLRNTPLARQQQPLQQQAQGLNAVNPARLIPQQANPHNFPIPAESQQRLAQNGVPRDRMSSWSEVINWIQEAHKQGILTDEQVAKFQQEYKQQGRPLSLTPRALMQQYQQQQQQAAAVSAGAASNLQAQNQQILMQQARQIQGQQINLQQSLQNQSQGIPPQMQMALSGIPIIPQQVQQQQAPLLQAQSSQQPPTQPQLQQPQQQPQPPTLPAQAPPQPQVQPVQQRKGRPPPRKPSAKKGQDAANPLVVGNTPTPTNIPTPSPAQLHASLPTTTPVHMASPATVPHPTPQGLGISPVDPNTTHTSSHVDNPQHPDSDAQARMANVVGQIRAEMEKQRQSLSNWITQLKELSPEQKEQMKAVIASPPVIEFLNRADKVLPFVWNHAKNEPQVQPFIQQFLRFVRTFGQSKANVIACLYIHHCGWSIERTISLHSRRMDKSLFRSVDQKFQCILESCLACRPRSSTCYCSAST